MTSLRTAAKPVRMAQDRRSKYRAKATVVDGIRFHSAAESRRYAELKLLEKAGKIDTIELQPEFELSVQRGGQTYVVGKYRGDFRYWEFKHCGAEHWVDEVVEDVKGYDTPLSRWKRKHAEYQYGIQIKVIR